MSGIPSCKMRLQSALDNDIYIAVQRFLGDGVRADIGSLYNAIQKSNSSLKRKPKKLLQESIERVLDAMGAEEIDSDSEVAIENQQSTNDTAADVMNRSLRANLSAPQVAPSSPTMLDGQLKKRRLANGESVSKRQKSEKATIAPHIEISLDDVGGMDGVIEQLSELLILPLKKPESYRKMNLRLPRGILLHGPPGCGKTMVTRAFAAELHLPFIEILGPSIVSGMSGESEKGIRERFEEAKKNAPCLIFIDELDSIAPKRDASQSQMEKRIVAQLLVSMDELGRDYDKPVMVLAATNRPDSIDPALRRGGRFDTEINIPVPNENVREYILKAQIKDTPVSQDVDFRRLANMTAGFVGADLQDFVRKAGSYRMRRYRTALEQQTLGPNSQAEMDIDGDVASTESFGAISSARRLIARLERTDIPEPPGHDDPTISMSDFLAVLPGITPSSKREGFATIPDVSWDDIGALKSVREELQTAIVAAINNPAPYAAVGIDSPAGVLLWGPPGCGKTLLAKAVAAESKANFISVKGPELLNKFVGESEAAVRRVFDRARSSVPCVIFFDELDALVPRRGADSGSEVSARVVNTFLSELDGLNERKGIYVIAATNRPEVIDEALLRPGRLEIPLFVDLPGPDERVEILTTLVRDRKLSDMTAITEIARGCEGYSGADLGALVREAGYCAIRRESTRIETQDFQLATERVEISVKNIKKYERLRTRFGRR